MKFLVTGASGFVGANLVREIAARGLNVIATTQGSPTQTTLDSLQNYEPLVRWASVDVREREQVESAIRQNRVETVLHCAAITSVSCDVSVGDMVATNVVGTRNVLEAARVLGIARVVYLSSGAVYGTREPHPPLVSESHPLRGDAPYGLSKIAAEQLCRTYAQENDYCVPICRLGTLYGPMELAHPHRPRVSIPCKLVNLALGGKPIKVSGISMRRPFCYVGDAARAVVDLALLPDLSSDTFNVGSPDSVLLSELLEIVSRLLSGFAYEVVSSQDDADLAMTWDDERPVLDTAHLESLLGPLHWLTIEDGIERTMAWVRKSPSALPS